MQAYPGLSIQAPVAGSNPGTSSSASFDAFDLDPGSIDAGAAPVGWDCELLACGLAEALDPGDALRGFEVSVLFCL